MKMNRFFFLLLLVALMPVAALAQYDFLTAHRGVIKGGFSFSVSLLICFPTWSAISRSTVQS